MSIELPRLIEAPEIGLKCRIYGHAPVQGEGSVMGAALYFRARGDGWTFAVATSGEIEAVDIDFPEQGFYREGDYGASGKFEASYMPPDVAEAIIRRCALEYVDSRGLCQ